MRPLGSHLIALAGQAPRMATEMDYQTLAGAIDDLARRGFTESLAVVGNELRTTKTQKIFRPDEVVIREYRRFEGVSDPDDMSIVYAIETEGGIRGTFGRRLWRLCRSRRQRVLEHSASAEKSMSIQSINPATGEILESFKETSGQELDRIL